MVDIQFNYKDKKTNIKCKRNDNVYKVFKRFASDNNLDFCNLMFYCEGSKIDIFLDLKIEEQFDLKNKSKKINKIQILVFDDISPEEYFVKFIYKGEEELIKCARNEKVSIICKNFASKVKVDISKLLFFFGGRVINDIDNETFYELAKNLDRESKNLDRESKVICILVCDFEEVEDFGEEEFQKNNLKNYQESRKNNLENHHLIKLIKYLSL